jgi:hypothetical protein
MYNVLKLLYLPSAPVSSTIVLMFFANNFLLFSVAAAIGNALVSPQPPMATIIEVPGANLDRVVLTEVWIGHSVFVAWLNKDASMKASATWVISDTRSGAGTS